MSLKPQRPPRLLSRVRFRVRYALIALIVVIALGTLGFCVIEGWSLIDSLFMTVTTVTTVGYGEVHPLSQSGRIFAIILMLVGVGTVAYALSSTVQSIVQWEVISAVGERRRVREMSKLQNHVIICGAGRVGSRIIRQMQREKCPFVAIEQDPAKAAALIAENKHVLVSDATLEDSLRAAGVDRARALAACLPDDADNLYVVLTARDLNPGLHIVARAVEEQAEPKLIRAGANRVVSPTIIGSRRMAEALTRPAVADFMDSITAENLDLGFEEVELRPGSAYAGRELKNTNIRSELDVVIVAIRRRDGHMLFNPTGDAVMEAGDLLIAIGRAEALMELTRQAGVNK